MESVLLILFTIPYIILRYLLSNHETAAEKDERQFAEGLGLVESRQYDEALAYFSLIVQRFPKSATAHLYKGRCNLALGNYYSALYDFSISQQLDNTLPDCYLYKGQAHFHVQEYGQAFVEFDKGVWHTRSQSPDVLRWRGLASVAQGNPEKARMDFEKALTLGDENAAFHLNTLFTRDGIRLRDLRRDS